MKLMIDLDWLKGHQPICKKPLIAPRVNWEERDKHLRVEAEAIVKSLIVNQKKPVRITPATVAREMGYLARIQHNPDKLPLTWDYLRSVSESREEFARRRILWVISESHRQGIVLPIWQIARKAGIRRDIQKEVFSVFEVHI